MNVFDTQNVGTADPVPQDHRQKPVNVLTPTAVYRYFNAAGTLLYVGATANPKRRAWEHGVRQRWWCDVASASFEWFADRQAAMDAEAAAIRAEKPLHNKTAMWAPWPPRLGGRVLRKWLHDNGVTEEQFAAATGIRVDRLRRVLSGRWEATRNQADRIATATGGGVPLIVWHPEWYAHDFCAADFELIERLSEAVLPGWFGQLQLALRDYAIRNARYAA